MKKILMLVAVALWGFQAQATTIAWGINRSYFGSTALGANATGYLVYLGEGAVDWTTTTTDYKAIAQGTGTGYLDSWQSSSSSISHDVGVTFGSTPVFPSATDGKITNQSSVYGLLLAYTKEGQTYMYLGDIHKVDTGDSSYKVATETFEWVSSGIARDSSESGSSNQGWQAVPEPSVALMGLLGIGMLIKRRRA